MPVTQPAAEFVLDFFARFIMKPDRTSLDNLLVALLDLELRRARHNVFSDSPLFRVSPNHTSDMALAERALNAVRKDRVSDGVYLEVQHYWLRLMGHRLAAERGLPVEGYEALGQVASLAFGLPPMEAEDWSDDVLFETFTATKLRAEWEYEGLHFRTGPIPPLEAL